MDQPFRPSDYLHRLRRHWLLIVIPVIVALIVAVILGLITPVRYTAAATLSAPNPQLVWRWDNKVYDYVDWRFDWRTEVMPLITTREVAQRALDKVDGQLSTPISAEELNAATSTRLGHGSLFTISVSAADPQDAALLANALAAALPEAVADLYAGNIDLYSEALAEAQTTYDEADQALRDFRGKTGIGLGFGGDIASLGEQGLFGAQSAIKQELTLVNSDRAAANNMLVRIDSVLQAIEGNSPSFNIALLNVPQLASYGLDYAALQQQAAQDPEAFAATLHAWRQQVSANLATLEEKASELQFKHADYTRDWDNILQERGVWLESVTSLERKQIELKMKRIIEGERVQVIDEAQTPSTPSQPNWALYLGVALLGGLLGGLLLAIIAVYLRDPAA